ncbi:hypothetical protein [Asticcacaulis sp. YBE204]|uniref:hypothetical protein n=1 Tax=Asticcacaulis sp. YBE204 TaxID=1282363 RepID=UPI0003C3BFAA|nr:hypothetical protein [Asticcacaulis sp. YBE204]ESQ80852.1 hypothetical protein AEYBE204_00595 [Asticcacaulis sp. YBE204]
MTDPKPKIAPEDLLTNERDNESSIGDLDIDTNDADDINQNIEPTKEQDDDLNFGQGKPVDEADDLNLVREGGKGEEDLGYTR